MPVNFYEKMVLLLPFLSDEEVKDAINKISSVITDNGGEVLKIENWGKRRLAYRLNKQSMGYYVLFIFKSSSKAIKIIEDFYKVYDPVLKYMIIKLSKEQISALPADIKGIPVEPSEIKPKE